MSYTCYQCKVQFTVEEKDVLERDYTDEDHVGTTTKVDPETSLFSRTRYRVKQKETYQEIVIRERYIVCPLCGTEHEISSKVIEKKGFTTHTNELDEIEAFGPNHPNIVGDTGYAYRNDF